MNVLIVGGGKVGSYLAGLLVDDDHQVRLIERNPGRAALLEDQLTGVEIVAGSGTDPALLEKAGIHQTDVVAAVTHADETNLVVTSLARFEFAVPRTIARINDPRNAWMYTQTMGVDIALNQADLMSHLIAEEMSLGDMTTLLTLRRGQYRLVEEKAHPAAAAVGVALQDLELPSRCIFVAVIRGGDIVVPHGDFTIQPEDEVLALIHTDEIGDLAAILGSGSGTGS